MTRELSNFSYHHNPEPYTHFSYHYKPEPYTHFSYHHKPEPYTIHMLFTHCSQFFWDTLNFSGLFFTSFSFSFFLSLTLHTIQQANSALHFLTPLLCFQFNPFSLLFLLFHCLACPFFHYCPSFPQAFFCLFRPLSLALYLFENLCGPEGELGSKSL